MTEYAKQVPVNVQAVSYADKTREDIQRQELERLRADSPNAYLAGHNKGWNDGFKAGEQQGIEKGAQKVVDWIENHGGWLDGCRKEWQAFKESKGIE